MAPEPDGLFADPPTSATGLDVVLNSGQAASALFEGETGPVDALGPCPSYTALVVTPPNETHSVRVAAGYSICYLEIHPVVPGSSGRANAP